MRCNGYNKGSCDVSDGLVIEEVKELILSEIKRYITNPININIKKNIKKEEINEQNIILGQLDFLTKKEKRIKDAYINGIDGLEEYKNNKELVQKEKEQLMKQLEKLKEVKKEDKKDVIQENLKNVYDILIDENIDMKKKYDIVHELINYVEYKNGSLTLFFNEIK